MTSTGSESDTESSMTDRSDITDSDSDSDYSNGKPEPEDCIETVGANEGNDLVDPVCLLCPSRVPLEDLWNHLKSSHQFDIFGLRKKFRMDQISFIKLINFIRREVVEVCKASADSEKRSELIDKLVSAISGCSSPLWDSDKYLLPVVEEDPALSYWFDETEDGEDIHENVDEVKTCEPSRKSESVGLETLLEENSQLFLKNQKYEQALAEAFENMKLMKEVMNRICGDDKLTSKQLVLKRYNDALSKHNVDYFESYDDLQIHATMINDTQRTEAYQNAISKNSVDFKNKVVLDVGCGTSILSMFAAKAGASKVFAVDRSNILDKAVQIVRENELQNVIECVKGTVETIKLPVEKVDIIISEFMGYFLLFEGMLASYIEARKKFLRPGGAMYPNTAQILIMGISEMDKFEETSKMWDNVYGFKMSAMKVPRKLSPVIEAVKQDKCITDAVQILSLDLMTCEYEDAAFESNFSLTVTEEKSITGIVGYFDVGFTMGSDFQNTLSTGPALPETHWYQTTFPLSKPILAKKGDAIPGVFECRPNLQNPRSLDITLTIAGERYTYLLD